MNRGGRLRRLERRRLSEIRAGHGVLHSMFGASSDFQPGEFEAALGFVARGGVGEVVPAASVVRCLANWYQDGNPGVACRVVDAGAFTGGMLWLQSAVNRVVRDLGAGRPAVLLVTGLCETIRGPERRWTRSAERERQESVRLLEEQVLGWAKKTRTPISLFVA